MIRIVAGRRFWRFELVNQLPLSIMAVHAQYRATVHFINSFSFYWFTLEFTTATVFGFS